MAVKEVICRIVRDIEGVPCLLGCEQKDFTYNAFRPNEPEKYGFTMKEVLMQRCFVYDLALERELIVTLYTQQNEYIHFDLKKYCRNDERWYQNVLEDER